MLERRPADAERVVSRGLIASSCVCCALVLASFTLFALGQASGASKAQVAALSSQSVSVRAPHAPGQPKRFIDGAARALTSPFRSFVHTDSQWAIEIASTLFALIVYGLGLGYLARWART
jgi:hypothetical protein